jgi:polygalacturonase
MKVREFGARWQVVDLYHAKVAEVVNTITTSKKTTFAYFDCTGNVEVSLKTAKSVVKSVKIRPLALGIKPIIEGNRITFKMKANQNISVEINGDIFHNLQIFANKLESKKPLATDTNVIYYGPGLHRAGKINMRSGQTLYIAGGAVVEGSINIDHVKNVHIKGRGILTQIATTPQGTAGKNVIQSNRNDAVAINYSANVDVDGIIILPHKYSVLIGQSKSVNISNVKSFSTEGNADGIDIFSSTDVTLDHLYMRNSDDCIAIYGHRWNYYGNTKNVIVKNCILWADVAHPILIGTHGDSVHPDSLTNIKFSNIDILDQHENQMDYQGCLSLNAGDSNLIKNILFDNIRIEEIRKGQLFNLRVMYNKKYNTSAGNGIRNILFRDITYTGSQVPHSIITGYDDKRSINHVVFENLRINGAYITDEMKGKPKFYKTGDMANIFIGEHVEDIIFTRSSKGKL